MSRRTPRIFGVRSSGSMASAMAIFGSFFSQAKLSITQINIDIMYAYFYEKALYKSLAREIRIESEAICNWRNFIRDVYAEHLIRNPVRIGGVGRTVEIDKSAFVKRKHVGRQVRTQWVFGGLDTTTQEAFLVAVPRRDAATLLPVLQSKFSTGDHPKKYPGGTREHTRKKCKKKYKKIEFYLSKFSTGDHPKKYR